jgi:hypothetical protein
MTAEGSCRSSRVGFQVRSSVSRNVSDDSLATVAHIDVLHHDALLAFLPDLVQRKESLSAESCSPPNSFTICSVKLGPQPVS